MQDAWGKAVLSEFQLSNIRTLVFCLWHSIDYSPARTVVEQESCRSMPRRRTMTACRTCTWRSTTPPSCSTTPPSWPTAACGVHLDAHGGDLAAAYRAGKSDLAAMTARIRPQRTPNLPLGKVLAF